MRLTAVILIFTLMQVSAASFGQRLTLKQNNVSFDQLFSEIRNQTGYDVLVSTNQLKVSTKIDVNFKDAPLEKVLNEMLSDRNLTYVIEDKTIVIKEKQPSFLDRLVDAFIDIRVSGRVVDEKGIGLAGATVKVKGGKKTWNTESDGSFIITIPDSKVVLQISYVGYKTKEVEVSETTAGLVLQLELVSSELKEVAVVSTGYQTLPKERAAGSFEMIDNKLFNRTVGPDVISRLESVVAGLQFDKRGIAAGSAPGISSLTVRGLSTIDANTAPLVVLDNFPYEGNVSNINPNDVENITILKDAAAASIWGARAGNGVIVITTKKGAYDKPLELSFNSNLTIANKPDLFYLPIMKTSDFIDVEKFLFAKGGYDDLINDIYSHPYLSPVVEILDQQRSGTINEFMANTKIDGLRMIDVRNDYLKYAYRKQLNQQYALNLNGGSKTFGYMVSGGYDKGLGNTVRNSKDRLTLRTDLTFKPVKNLEIQLGSIYTKNQSQDLASYSQLRYGSAAGANVFSYSRLVDGEGNPIVVGRDFRTGFIQQAVIDDPRLIDWQYRPLDELDASSNRIKDSDWLLNLGAKYKLSEVFSVDVKYQYGTTLLTSREWYGPDSYYMRNQINLFTQPVGSAIEKPLPNDKGLLNDGNSEFNTSTIRGQLNLNKTWDSLHQLTAIAGAERRQNKYVFNQHTTLGYDERNLGYQNSDFNTEYTLYFPTNTYGFRTQLPGSLNYEDQTNRFTSVYANAAYTYNNRYTVSASARKDASNLFGVKTNQRGVPLWSAGFGWNIAQEPFYHLKVLPLLKLRATYGYSGNTRSDLSAYSTIQYQDVDPYTNLPKASIRNPENSALRWEKVGTFNLGLDFGVIGNRLSGSLEYYTKHAKDVLYLSPLAFSSGFSSIARNSVDMKGKGIDLTLHSSNLASGSFIWNTDFVFSYNQCKITRFDPVTPPSASEYTGRGSTSILPILGKPLYAVYSYKWGGLDPQTGDPQGYDTKGQLSKAYSDLNTAPVENLQYHGSAIPLYFGHFRNTFSWKSISISANISYKLDYYIRRTSIDYINLFGYTGAGPGHADYARRWQKPGDERITDVPSAAYPADSNREQFYTGSAALVSKGDHIRLQDITVGYALARSSGYFKNMRFYANVSNLGIIWRDNKQGIDPDYGVGFPAPRMISLGLNANF